MMQHPFLTRLASDLRAAGGIPIATVVAVSAGLEPLTILYRGALIPGVMKGDSYDNPQPGDRVVVESWDGVLFVHDSIGASAAPYGPELLPNPGFEIGIVGDQPSSWNDFWGEQVELDDTVHLSGSSSARLETATLSGADQVRCSTTDAIEVDAGVTYRVGAWFMANSLNALLKNQVLIITAPEPENASPFGVGSSSFEVAFSALTLDWKEVAGTRTIPAGHSYARVFLSAVSTATPGSTLVWVDEATMRKQL